MKDRTLSTHTLYCLIDVDDWSGLMLFRVGGGVGFFFGLAWGVFKVMVVAKIRTLCIVDHQDCMF